MSTSSASPSAGMQSPVATNSGSLVARATPLEGMPSKVGLAFQGGSFLAGAVDAGVVRGLHEAGAFDRYNINSFSGTSAGALVAAVCWRHALQERMADAPDVLRRQWLHNAYGVIQNQETGDFLKLLDYVWSATNPFYFYFKDHVSIPVLHWLFQLWLDSYVQPETCVRILYDRYILHAQLSGDLAKAQEMFAADQTRPHLIVGATRVTDSEDVTFTDEDFFGQLISALQASPGDPEAAIRAAAEYMRQGIMASGSLDSINGMTTVQTGFHTGVYLDGAWAENPPLKGLLDAGVSEIWSVEVFPKRCAELPHTFAEREDRREELWQNAVAEQQLAFINTVNRWVANGWLPSDLPSDRYRDVEKRYRHVETRCIELPPEMQHLTAGARIVNAPGFLIDKMELGRANALRFMSTLH